MFKKVLLAAAVTAASSVALADTVQGYFGFRSSAPVFGAAYDHRLSDGYEVGGLFLMASEEDDVVNEIMTLAGRVKASFRPTSPNLNMYVAPGFGIHMIEDGSLEDGDDVTALGPILQLGVLMQATPKVAFGVEVTNIFNWLADDAASDAKMLNATVTFLTY